MTTPFSRTRIALSAVTAICATTVAATAQTTSKTAKLPGKYVAGDIHNHTTCSDGSISMQKLVKKSTDTVDTPWGLDWFVQAGHGGSGNRNCTLAEDASLATPAYPLVVSTTGVPQGPTTTWQSTNPPVQVKGLVSGTPPAQNMWRWQSVQEFQYPVLEYLAALKNKPMFIGVESVAAGHEHTSTSVITGQMPVALDNAALPASGPYVALGNANALAQWEYCFDRNDTDTGRGNTTVGSGVGNNWNCGVTGSLNAADPSWSALAQKLIPAGGTGTGNRGHAKTVEATKWMAELHPNGSYYLPTHLERAGPFNPDGNNGFNIEHLRNFNNAAPNVAFGFETQPGHGASSDRGEYATRRNAIAGVNVDSVGGTTYGGTGVYGAQVGGVWDALLGEGRNYWFFASSDWHNRGSFGADDRRSTQDFYPGEYQRSYTMVRNGSDKLRPQTIVDGMRTGNIFTTSGQLIDRLAFVACASYAGPAARSNAAVEKVALEAAAGNTDIDVAGCATMGEKLVVRPGADIVVSIVVRDPSGPNYSPYTFPNPSLRQIGVTQPLNQPVLDHIDVVRGLVSGYKTPGSADYAGQWPNTWVNNPNLATVPAAAKNTSAAVIRTFNGSTWTAAGNDFLKMTFRIPAVSASQYVRLRGSNLPASVPFETDASGNPLRDLETNAGAVNPTVPNGSDGIPANFYLQIPCTTVGTTEFNGCPAHLPTKTIGSYTGKVVAYDVAAWSDLWFYSNPIYVQVQGSTIVAESDDRSVCSNGASNWLREPLLHFVVIGAVLFGVDQVLVGRADDPRTIVVGKSVTDEAKTAFRQSRGREPNADELRALTERWVDNEVLYREGLAMQVERGDSMIRDRVIFKSLMVVESGLKPPPVDDAVLRRWFEANRVKYDEPARYDFQEAMLSGDDSEAAALAFAQALNAGTPGDAKAGLRVFKGRPHDNLVQSYGADFAGALAAAPAGEWRVLPTRDGLRVMRLDAISPARPAVFEALRNVVLPDWTDATMAQLRTDAVRERGKKYAVEYSDRSETTGR